ncbi:HalD/BesD family halogenase [Streptomyces varsoviensis]|uniref:HalD/BesD family halogenase n=1 Tax=Streptomyces varsoviensis TaxID=67373 RepID=UPI000AB21F74|nr:hypothetical protein [Streptomyces varsoviensis]
MPIRSVETVLEPARLAQLAEAGALDDGLRERFERDGYVKLPGVVRGARLGALRSETRRLERLARRRDFTVARADASPRRMATVCGQMIGALAPWVPRLYADAELTALIRRISGVETAEAPDLLERYVLNVLHRQGDTHGAHLDGHPLTFVLCADAPSSPRDGGLLEYAPGERGPAALDGAVARRAHHRPGDAYLLRGDAVVHRVTPLRRAGLRRTVLALSYEARSPVPRAARVPEQGRAGRPAPLGN